MTVTGSYIFIYGTRYLPTHHYVRYGTGTVRYGTGTVQYGTGTVLMYPMIESTVLWRPGSFAVVWHTHSVS